MEEWSKKFLRFFRMFENDRHGANQRSFAGWVHRRLAKEISYCGTCAAHRTQSCQTEQFAAIPGLISGLVNVGMLFKQGGAYELFQNALRFALRARLSIVRGFPPPPATSQFDHQEEILKVFLDSSDGPDMLRAHVLRTCISSSWSQRRVYCIVPHSIDLPSMDEVIEELVQALCPFQCPKLERDKWIKSTKALKYRGLFSNCCHLLDDILGAVTREFSDHKKQVGLCDFTLSADPPL